MIQLLLKEKIEMEKGMREMDREDRIFKNIKNDNNLFYQINKEENGIYKKSEDMRPVSDYEELVNKFGEERINAAYGQKLVEKLVNLGADIKRVDC